MFYPLPWHEPDSIELPDWLRARSRPDIPYVPAKYASVTNFLSRLYSHRLSEEDRQRSLPTSLIDHELRQCLAEGRVTAFLISDLGKLRLIEPHEWRSPFLWHRAKFGRDMDNPREDHDGHPVSDEAWDEVVRAANVQGVVVLDCSQALVWLGHDPSPVRELTYSEVLLALRKHLNFDQETPPAIVRRNLVKEIKVTLTEAGYPEWADEAEAFATDMRPAGHSKPGPRRSSETESWQKAMLKKRKDFKLLD